MKKSIFIFTLVFFAFVFFIPSVYAITKTSGDLEVTYDTEPLFGSDIIWYPGLSKIRSLTIKNIGSETHRTYFKADNTSETGDLSTVMYFKINKVGTVFYGNNNSKTMRNFWGDGEISLSDVQAGKSTIYDIAITFWRQAGNEFQKTQTKFDLIIGFEGTEDEVIVPAGPDNGDDGDDGGDDGTGGGEDSSPPSPSPSPLVLGAFFTPFTEDFQEVLGTSTPSGELSEEGLFTQAGEVKGTQSKRCWLWLLLLLLLLLLLYLLYRRRRVR